LNQIKLIKDFHIISFTSAASLLFRVVEKIASHLHLFLVVGKIRYTGIFLDGLQTQLEALIPSP
jgi:hypothetical protein